MDNNNTVTESYNNIQNAISHISDDKYLGIAIIERQGRLIYSNQRFDELLMGAFHKDEMTFNNKEDGKPKTEDCIANLLSQSDSHTCIRRYVNSSGRSRFTLFHSASSAIAGIRGGSKTIVAIDVTDEMLRQQFIERILGSTAFVGTRLMQEAVRLEHLSTTDPLTGAWNRRWFEEASACEMYRMQRHRHPVSLILIDIDHFKIINDKFGHQIGDEVLVILANSIRNVCREGDSLARWGGEEFAVLASNTGLIGAQRLAERIATGLRLRSFPVSDAVTISMGVTEYLSSEDFHGWVARTDKALYIAKESGRNRIEVDRSSDFSEDRSIRAVSSSFLRLEWNDEYCCGHQVIDQQHRTLFMQASLVLEAMVAGSSQAELGCLIEQLLNSVNDHHAYEEILLSRSKYPHTASHIAEHQRLLSQANNMKIAYNENRLKAGDIFEYIAIDVISKHILKADRDFFSHLPTNKI